MTAEVEMVVLSPFAVCSPVASSCTGTCWDLKSGKANARPASRDSIPVAHRLQDREGVRIPEIRHRLALRYRALEPVDFGVALSGP